jgi:hypothetical protein
VAGVASRGEPAHPVAAGALPRVSGIEPAARRGNGAQTARSPGLVAMFASLALTRPPSRPACSLLPGSYLLVSPGPGTLAR